VDVKNALKIMDLSEQKKEELNKQKKNVKRIQIKMPCNKSGEEKMPK
jgi:hypothetical protein